MITLRFDKLYAKERVARPSYVSIPFPKGELRETENVALYQNGKKLKQQQRILSKYQDGSVRYLFLRFLADIPANKGAEVLCDVKGEAAEGNIYANAEVADLQCEKQENGFRIANGMLDFSVENDSFYLFEKMSALGKNYEKTQFCGPGLKINGEDADRKSVV